MALFPRLKSIRYSRPESMTMKSIVLRTSFATMGKKRLKKKSIYPKRNLVLRYKNLTAADFKTLRQFYVDNVGSIFTFIHDEVDYYRDEYVATGDGSTTVLTLPCKGATACSLYADGSELTGGGTDWTLATGAGPDGEDTATLATSDGTLGKRYTCRFNGRLRMRCTFADDSANLEVLYSHWKRFGIGLEGFLNDE